METSPLAVSVEAALAVLDQLDDSVDVLDAQYRYVLVNQAWERHTGLQREVVRGVDCRTLMPRDEFNARFYQQLEVVMATGQRSQTIDDCVIGAEVFQLRAQPFGQGGVMVQFANITAQVRAKQAAQDRQQLLTRMMAHLPGVSFGVVDRELFSSEEEYAPVHAGMLAALAGQPAEWELHFQGLVYRVRGEPFADAPDGSVAQIIILGRDATREVELETRIQNQLQEMQLLLLNFPGIVAEYNTTLTLTNLWGKGVANLPATESWLGKTLAEISAPHSADVMAYARQALQGQPQTFETQAGGVTFLMTIVALQLTRNGTYLYTMAFDISERAQREAELQRLNGELAAAKGRWKALADSPRTCSSAWMPPAAIPTGTR